MRQRFNQIPWFIVAILIAIGIFVYWLEYGLSLVTMAEVASPLTIAVVLLGIGSFIVLGSQILRYRRPLLQSERRFIFIYLGIGAISFVVSFFLLKIVHNITSPTLGIGEWVIVVITAIFMSAAAVASGMAISAILQYLTRNIV